MVELPIGGSATHNPELNWCQVRETLLMLGIAVAQVRHAMDEGSTSFSTLSTSFASTYMHIEELKTTLAQSNLAVPAELQLAERVTEISAQNSKSIVAFQFYDRLSQRLDHVCGTISQLASLVSDPTQIDQPDAWLALQQRIRSQFSMEQEKVLFDAILSGMPISEALVMAGNMNDALAADIKKPDDGEIEFF
ncbi:hypothetical protein [Deefgea rivuli]|uniref:hypothetical protein n=1 Tax=Deefgea rivuli TaxID=400948 RepID=UPI0006841BE0|nr:hypothetical protein [Deefgea rivuli]